MNYGVVANSSTGADVAANRRSITKLDHRPNIPGPWVYVVTGDPELDTDISPDWESDIYFVAGAPIAFRNDLDGLLGMKGVYDLTAYDISAGPVSDDAFILPFKWRDAAPAFAYFPIEVATDEYIAGVQRIDHTTGMVRLTWPVKAALL